MWHGGILNFGGQVIGMAAVQCLTEYLRKSRKRLRRPFVTLSYAQSLDGSISARAGEPLTISGPDSLVLTHKLRACHDCILVVIGTVLSDNPRLNVRLVEGKNPRPIILDSRLRLPPKSNIFSHNGDSPLVITRENSDKRRAQTLIDAGATVLEVPANARGQISLTSMIDLLAEMGVRSIMVEGGSRVITSFLMARLADYIVLTVVPVLVGGLRAVSDLNQSDPGCFLRIRNLGHEWLGEDLIVWGSLL